MYVRSYLCNVLSHWPRSFSRDLSQQTQVTWKRSRPMRQDVTYIVRNVVLFFRMTMAAEDQLTPSMCEQPLTSGGHVYDAPPVLEEKYGDMKEAEGPLTTSDQEDCWPDSNNVTRSDQRLKKRKYLETASLYAAYFARVCVACICLPLILFIVMG